MEFRLVYEGSLPSTGNSENDSKKKVKAAIRREVHFQMEDLWTRDPLRHIRSEFEREHVSISDARLKESNVLLSEHGHPNYFVDGVKFIPLVSAFSGLIAEIDILFLRPEDPGNLVHSSGDIDNRVKTLLDALTLPRVGDWFEPVIQKPASPSYCLLQDDKLVSALRVETDRLLGHDARKRASNRAGFVHCIIRVKLRRFRPSVLTMDLS